MAETRPSGLPVISDDDATVIQEVAEIDERRRLHLLPRWAKRTDWLPVPAKGTVNALMTFVEPGLLSLRDWKVDGPRIVERYKEVSEEPGETAFETLRLIQDRYRRLPISIERRPYLGEAALAHLGIPLTRGMKSVVYVAVSSDRIDLLGPIYRNSKLIAGDLRIDDLP